MMKVVKPKVLINQQVSDRYWHMVVEAANASEIQPGQFFNIRCADEYYPFLRRPFSIYRINREEGTIEFLYLVKGLGTERLTRIQPGETVDLFGPLGKGFTLPQAGPILMVARGVGIATLAALAQEASRLGITSIAILSARSRNDLLAAETLQGLGAEVYKVTEEDGNSSVEHVRLLVEGILHEHDIQAAYTCGSRRLSRLLQNVTTQNGIYSEIALEEHMGCAMGVCFACVCDVQEKDGTLKTVRVCTEGPVFPLEQVVLT